MISAELNHNPYLLRTSVKFNGQSPRINSQIEKYEHQPLKDWVHLVPDIFYNEMNGYDFDLLFVGTSADFEEVKNAFSEYGVLDDEVRLIQKNIIEDVDTKSQEVEALISWLRDNPNRNFDYNAFWEGNSELFEGSYPYIVIGGLVPEKNDSFIDIESVSVSNAKELNSTVLTSTPILFFFSRENEMQIRSDLALILSRKDIRQDQLFFMIHPMMDNMQVTRIIEDLGVESPQVVTRCFDEQVTKFIRNYPVTEYIRNAITVFISIAERIGSLLDIENEKSIAINEGIHTQINALEADITRLKKADFYFVQIDNYAASTELDSAKLNLIGQIQKWKNRKIKIVGDEEAEAAADEYEGYLFKAFQDFQNTIIAVFEESRKAIDDNMHAVYVNTEIDPNFLPSDVILEEKKAVCCPKMKNKLLSLKQVTYQDARGNLFGLFKKSADTNPEPIRITTYNLEQWRDKAKELILPVANRMIWGMIKMLNGYYYNQAENYHKHLTELIEQKKADKEKVASMLSDEEKKLQQDNDWLATFTEQLYRIQRG